MAQPYCTGPCAFFVGVGSNDAPVFLGHAEAGVEIYTALEWERLMNDLTGTVHPLDKQNMGENAVISGQGPFTRWNESAFALMEARQNGNTRGSQGFGVRGGFAIGEGLSFPLYLAFPYSIKAAMRAAANGILESGRRYRSCTLMPHRFMGGTRAARRQLSWEAASVLRLADGGHDLYDYNLTGLPPIN